MSTRYNSNEVPHKFLEWLLAMGCPPNNIPTVDKISGMCRGQYYMLWRSLIERVDTKDIVRNKRLQVFCDDVKRCQKRSVFSEIDTSVVQPEELSLWSQHSELKEKVADAEASLVTEKEKLRQLMDKNSSKLSHRILSRKLLQDAQRRLWLLHKVAEELKEMRAKLQETKTIADSLCAVDEGADIESKMEKFMVAISRIGAGAALKSGASLVSTANPAACSSLVSTYSETNEEELMSSLDKYRGDALFKQLLEQRTGLYAAMSATRSDKTADDNKIKPQSVLAHTAALHSTLALQSMKNLILIQRTRDRLASAILELSNYLDGEECELLVICCEKASVEAQLTTLRTLCDDRAAWRGIFSTGAVPPLGNGDAKNIHSVDKAIETKRDEVRNLTASAAVVERKTQNVKDCLVSLFSSFHDDGAGERFGGRISLPLESMLTLRQFYKENSEKHKNKMELSMKLDVSESTCSFSDPTDNRSPTFSDELKFYLKKFSLEKNRKLVLESGEKIWIFETLQSSLHDLYAKWRAADSAACLLPPSASVRRHLRRLARRRATKTHLEAIVRELENGGNRSKVDIDVETMTAEEQKTLDRIKKRLNENIFNLQKTNKTLDTIKEHLHLWSDNGMKKYISASRVINGRTYRAYESAYLESLEFNK